MVPAPARSTEGPAGTVHVGTSGWHYPHWEGVFYPEGLDPKAWLGHYASRFDTVEVNNTFYRLPAVATLRAWRSQVPAEFRFAVKMSRYLTHMKKLKDPEEPLRTFLGRIAELGPTLGPVLFQLPPRWRPDVGRLRTLLACLPDRLRFAFEFRDPRWFDDAVLDALRQWGAAFCIYDLAGTTSPKHVTTDLVYVRLHGPSELRYAGSYPDGALDGWAHDIRGWREDGHDVVIYFDNDTAGNAPRDAARLLKRLG